MLLRLYLVAAFSLFFVDSTHAEDRQYLGIGYLAVNDNLIELDDRWRTGSLAVSYVRGPEWTGTLPTEFGALLEYRFLGEVISPTNIVSPPPGDRPYAGALSFGVHTHFQRRGAEWALGADLVVIGPQTKLDQFQAALHDIGGISGPSDVVLANQIRNEVIPSVVAEVGYPLALSDMTSLRPFAELRVGVENMLRVGADLTIGPVGQSELLTRDPVTGHRYRTIRTGGSGFALVLGADIAAVDSSAYLPASRGLAPKDTRTRARLGLHWQGRKASAFYGLTYHSEEFVGQPRDQLTGAVQFHFAF